jgi:hypothetical protein
MGVGAAVVAQTQMSFAFAFAGCSTGPMDQLADNTIAHGANTKHDSFREPREPGTDAVRICSAGMVNDAASSP